MPQFAAQRMMVVAASVLLCAPHLMAERQTAASPPPVGREGPQAASAITPTATFDARGRLWVAWVQDSHVWVSQSTDRGRTFGSSARVTRVQEDVDSNGEARPKIVLAAAGDVYVTWTRRGAKPFTGDIRFAASRDDGRTFSPPVTINDDKLEIGHRFDSLHVNRAGHLYIAWIDKRDLERATAKGADYAGAALYYTMSRDGGRTFLPNQKIKDHICECCRLAIDFDRSDLPLMVWRDVIGGTTRDHGIVRFTAAATVAAPARATTDGWKIDACPHHGPSVSIADDGTLHMTWFTGEGPTGAGSFYARSTDGGKTFSTPLRVSAAGTNMHAGAHAVVLSRGAHVVLAWKGVTTEADGRPLFVRESRDGGRTWAQARVIARAKAESDHPFLLANGADFFVSWFAKAEGYRLLPIEPARATDRQ